MYALVRVPEAAAGVDLQQRMIREQNLTTMHPVVTRTDARLDRVEDVTRAVAETTQPGGVDALVALLDRLPALAYAMDHEVMPLVCHLDQLGLEVNRLLDRFARLSPMTRRLPRVFRRGSSPHS